MPGTFQQAFHLMRSGRPGPVLIDLPIDVQMTEIEFDVETYAPLPGLQAGRDPRPGREGVRHAGRGASGRCWSSGGGVINADAADLLVEFAELTGVPVIPTLMGWGTIPDDHELNAGMVGPADLAPLRQRHHAGRRLRARHRQPLGQPAHRRVDTYTAGRTFVHVDIEPTQIGRVFAPDFGIVSDAKAALELFVTIARERKAAGTLPDRSTWAQECQLRKQTMLRKTHFDNVPVKPQRVYQEMNRALERTSVRLHHRPLRP